MVLDSTKQLCKLGIWDESVPGIIFNEDGISNYAVIQQTLMKTYPRGQKGLDDWNVIVEKVRAKGKRQKYNCIVGISGGVDSSYLLYLIKEKYGLRPLAVTLDNGWSSEIAVKNIKLVTEKLNVDLVTHVIDYEEIKDLIRSYMFASLPWIDAPTDAAIKGLMYKIALREGIKFIFRGNDFRTEGKQPRAWTYSDRRQLKYLHKKYGNIRLKTFPSLSLGKILYSTLLMGVKEVRPYYYLDYSKAEARTFLEREFGWKYYGGHHHENIFTKFVMSYWLPEKFKIDKRKITLSAQILSDEISREQAISAISVPTISTEQKEEIVRYVLKKLDLSMDDFIKIMSLPNKSYRDYPNNEKLLFVVLKYFSSLIKFVSHQKPMLFVEMEQNKR
ncbi:MAG: N-acetyl sugar amidotransferase [Candidatus Atribacteria bacterium]|nr:N-acetyl sugar amidotransferase [Candidatus Atribacteria bacterium]